MKIVIKVSGGICLLICVLILSPSLQAANLNFGSGGFNYSFPGPNLFYPITEDIDLKGSEYLEFKWRRTDFAYTRYYDFRLYKGYQILGSNRILMKTVSIDEYPLRMESAGFEPDQVYTWVLIQVLNNGRKSDKSFSSFKIINK